MKFLVSLLLGAIFGAAAVIALLVYNPMAGTSKLSPLSVSDQQLMRFSYSGVAESTLAYTNDGESSTKPFPTKVLQLWEAPVRNTDAFMTLLSDARGNTVGLGIKYMSQSESSDVVNGEANVDSVWHLILPGRGTMFVHQSENYWAFIRDVVLPAYWSSANSWRGTWNGNVTAGPGALGTATVTGGSGEFEGKTAEAVESLSARAYSTEVGPVSLEGHITIELHQPALTADISTD